MKKRIIIAGGGTGGHIFPAIAIANALRKKQPATEILFIGAKGKMEMEKVPQAGYKIHGIDISGYNRSSLIRNLMLPFKLMKSFVQVSRLVKSFKPDAAIGVGGYSTFPVLRYAQSKGIPTFIHESNSFAGRSNILLGKKAARVFVGGEGMESFFPKEKIMITGNPVRSAIVNSAISREDAIGFFGLNPALKTVLVTGGSLGAKSINEAIEASLDEFPKHDLQLIWQTGKPFAERANKASIGRPQVWTNDFIARMEYAFAAADIVVSRSGAMAISELCVVKKPVIFVPYPFAAEDHQTVNAKKLVDKDAAWLIKDSEVKEKLIPAIIELANDNERRQQMKKNISRLAVVNADETIASEIFKAIHD
ncbi:MAG TPA: undecaprenyldiphospho-muramoylpentapeptide beta-N-acetylglucosaminyltransferase [Flavitalea sp.]|nr:undecaprenyldiphospho-muramoylpentapeptide beta-N-acetylglucosaminyltransferase [Flavitalea sp.]